MTVDEIREILNTVRKNKIEYEKLKHQVSEYRNKLCSPGFCGFGDVLRSDSNGNATEQKYINLADKEAELAEMKKLYNVSAKSAKKIISLLPDDEAKLLTEYYLCGKRWKDIVETSVYYSERHCRRKINEYISKLAKRCP